MGVHRYGRPYPDLHLGSAGRSPSARPHLRVELEAVIAETLGLERILLELVASHFPWHDRVQVVRALERRDVVVVATACTD